MDFIFLIINSLMTTTSSVYCFHLEHYSQVSFTWSNIGEFPWQRTDHTLCVVLC